ncbi:MAG: transglutaminase family protein [Gammaproteobacteria bacterium]|jgi:transglutaminase-like putative cysteine protease
MSLRIRHSTTYRYRQPLSFGPHRLMLRPRESRNLRLLSHELKISPAAQVAWSHDVFGNSVAVATPDECSNVLQFESEVELELDVDQWPVFDIAASAAFYPFLLSKNEMVDLGALRLQGYLDSNSVLRDWASSFVKGSSIDTLDLLKRISAGVASRLTYEIREDEGVQTPEQTLVRNKGSCRDFAVLFVDAVRSLGFGARIVSGYLYDSDQTAIGSSGSGSTHAWAEVYVPGAGWITFDPTNRSVGGFNLIPVAVARDIRQTTPVTGSFVGNADAFEEMMVRVQLSSET